MWHLYAAGIELMASTASEQRCPCSRVCQAAGEFVTQAFAEDRRVCRTDTAQYQAIDMQDDTAHTHPLVSLSEIALSRFAASMCAARSKCDIPTGVPASAARNAAARAMLRMVPPGTARRASLL